MRFLPLHRLVGSKQVFSSLVFFITSWPATCNMFFLFNGVKCETTYFAFYHTFYKMSSFLGKLPSKLFFNLKIRPKDPYPYGS